MLRLLLHDAGEFRFEKSRLALDKGFRTKVGDVRRKELRMDLGLAAAARRFQAARVAR